FGENGAREGFAVGATVDGELVGVAAIAGRWVKLLAVAPQARGRGVATALLKEARTAAGGRPLRIGDHPGNYLSPGLDIRSAVGEVENLRAPLDGNPLVTEARGASLGSAATAAGYALRRVGEPDRTSLLGFVEREFAQVWAHEVARALEGPRRAVHAAFFDGT